MKKIIFKEDIMVAIHGTFILGIKDLSTQETYPLLQSPIFQTIYVSYIKYVNVHCTSEINIL